MTDWSRAPMSDIAGVDEAGRGPLAGDVVAAAVVLGDTVPYGIADSKKLSSRRRTELAAEIKATARAWCVARASVEEIDTLNILQATLLAMTRAVGGLGIAPHHVLVDGNRLPDWSYPSTAIVGGDASEQCIAAASILAKVARDDDLRVLDQYYPEYGFAQHKGYPTKHHLETLARYGASPVHRKSFAPVKKILLTYGSDNG